MSSASGSVTGSRVRIGLSSIRQNDITGAPIRSEPKLGNACAYRSSRNAADASSSAAVTTPWPPRPWNRTWNMGASGFCPLSLGTSGRRGGRAGRRPWLMALFASCHATLTRLSAPAFGSTSATVSVRRPVTKANPATNAAAVPRPKLNRAAM
jgi:hypothetical protein